jgi:hypothetical protein
MYIFFWVLLHFVVIPFFAVNWINVSTTLAVQKTLGNLEEIEKFYLKKV